MSRFIKVFAEIQQAAPKIKHFKTSFYNNQSCRIFFNNISNKKSDKFVGKSIEITFLE